MEIILTNDATDKYLQNQLKTMAGLSITANAMEGSDTIEITGQH